MFLAECVKGGEELVQHLDDVLCGPHGGERREVLDVTEQNRDLQASHITLV
jgi:hypothetical protein